MPYLRHCATAVAVALAFAAGPASSQTQSPPDRETRQAPTGQCFSGGPASPPGPRSDQPRANNPSDQLSQSGGIVCPPGQVDPDMAKPAPDVGRTPVIPPPGGPGSSVQPK